MQDAQKTFGDRQPHRPGCVPVAGALVICLCASRLSAGDPGGETVVRLQPSALVAADAVTLSDVAEVQGESAQLVARMELGAAPRPGQTGSLELTQLQAMLARRGVNLSMWVFRGASRCVVRRVAGPSRISEHTDSAAQPTPLQPLRLAMAKATTTQPQDSADPNTLEAVLRGYLSRRIASLNGQAMVRFSPGAARTLAFSRPTYDFRITDRSERLLGMVSLEVSILEHGQSRQTLPVLAEVSLRKSVVVAARAINRGELLKPAHLVLEERTFDRAEEVGVSELSQFLGQRAKRFIEARSTLSTRDIEPMPLVLTNDLVTVVVKRGPLSIRGSAKALGPGGLGDVVQLRNEMSKQIFTAVITGDKTVEVREAAAPPGRGSEPREAVAMEIPR